MHRWAWLGVGLAGMLACGDAFTLDPGPTGGGGTNAGGEPTTGGSGGSSTSNGGGGDGGCVNGIAAPPTPNQWEGPVLVAVSMGSALPACPDGMGTVSQTDRNNSSTECDCDCGFEVSQCTASLDRFDTTSCSNAATGSFPAGVGCSPAPSGASEPTSIRFKGGSSTATCEVGPGVAPPPISRDLLRCSVVAANGCIEVPDPRFEQRVCVWQNDDVSCPDGFPKRWSSFEFDDERTCQCTCTGETASCGGKLEIHENANCGSLVDSLNTGECGDISPSSALNYVPAPDGGSCTQTMGTVHNDVVKRNQATICCTDP